jgi:hypothetical protein
MVSMYDALPRMSLDDMIAEFEASVARSLRRDLARDARYMASNGVFSTAAARRVAERSAIVWG